MVDTNQQPDSVEPNNYQTLDLFEGDEKDRVYQEKIRILNNAIQEIGMGKYQVSADEAFYLTTANFPFAFKWYLFVVAGFGWFSFVDSYSL